ncbi:hypothetical protein ACFCV3_42015 [Kribbella sp. NPDC056345]|uniref:hypothetical protein n=1 Tax=Kribbella sp. NPDC056345 TaxID=3345789 RepID=UPI0035D83EAA
MIPTDSRPGEGEHARVVNPLSGREWSGPVLRWSTRSPQIRDAVSGEVRWFPPHWVRDVYTPPT